MCNCQHSARMSLKSRFHSRNDGRLERRRRPRYAKGAGSGNSDGVDWYPKSWGL